MHTHTYVFTHIQVDTFADGVAVKTTGVETLRLCRELVDDVVLCDNDEICVAIKDMFEDTRSITGDCTRSHSSKLHATRLNYTTLVTQLDHTRVCYTPLNVTTRSQTARGRHALNYRYRVWGVG